MSFNRVVNVLGVVGASVISIAAYANGYQDGAVWTFIALLLAQQFKMQKEISVLKTKIELLLNKGEKKNVDA